MAKDEKRKGFFTGFFDRFKKDKPAVEEDKQEITISPESEKSPANTVQIDTKDPKTPQIENIETSPVVEKIIEAEIHEYPSTKKIMMEDEAVKTPFLAKEKKAPETIDDPPAKIEVKPQTIPETPKKSEKIETIEEIKPVVEPVIEEEPEAQKSGGWFKRLKEGLDKTRKGFVFKMKGLFRLRNIIDDEFWEELEEILITADVGMETTEYIVDEMKKSIDEHLISEPSHLLEVMKEKLGKILEEKPANLGLKKNGLTVIVVVGVNGVGKTTSIAKIAHRLSREGKKVIVAAADTFRAAAIEQLEVWGNKLGLEIIKHKEGADPAAVVFDALSAAEARKADVLIIDTAGRLHSKVNLMKELEKIRRVVMRVIPEGPQETLLVLDSTTGQNALIQAKTFSESVDVTGIVLTKLDGTAKGGIVIGIVHELGIPVKFIGVGERPDDLRPFDSKYFLDALFSDGEDSEP